MQSYEGLTHPRGSNPKSVRVTRSSQKYGRPRESTHERPSINSCRFFFLSSTAGGSRRRCAGRRSHREETRGGDGQYPGQGSGAVCPLRHHGQPHLPPRLVLTTRLGDDPGRPVSRGVYCRKPSIRRNDLGFFQVASVLRCGSWSRCSQCDCAP